ncbi:MAG: hypothetical protein HYU36_17165 [Planctomycetes bacterium]|nr:hypothetical protein [Planctomycetota bacterium]
MENRPASLPILKSKNPELFFDLMANMVRKMLGTSADGVVYYEHCGNDERTWRTLHAAHSSA